MKIEQTSDNIVYASQQSLRDMTVNGFTAITAGRKRFFSTTDLISLFYNRNRGSFTFLIENHQSPDQPHYFTYQANKTSFRRVRPVAEPILQQVRKILSEHPVDSSD